MFLKINNKVKYLALAAVCLANYAEANTQVKDFNDFIFSANQNSGLGVLAPNCSNGITPASICYFFSNSELGPVTSVTFDVYSAPNCPGGSSLIFESTFTPTESRIYVTNKIYGFNPNGICNLFVKTFSQPFCSPSYASMQLTFNEGTIGANTGCVNNITCESATTPYGTCTTTESPAALT